MRKIFPGHRFILGIWMLLGMTGLPALAQVSKPCQEAVSQKSIFKFAVLPLQEIYQGEFEGKSSDLNGERTIRLTAVQRERFRVYLVNGRFVNRSGALINAGRTINEVRNPGLIIQTPDGRFYIAPDRFGETFKHSSLSDGQPLIFSGRITVIDGKVTMINDESGHYMPKRENLLNFVWILNQNKMDLKNCQIQLRFSQFTRTQKKYLRGLGVEADDLNEQSYLGTEMMFHHFWDPRFPL